MLIYIVLNDEGWFETKDTVEKNCVVSLTTIATVKLTIIFYGSNSIYTRNRPRASLSPSQGV